MSDLNALHRKCRFSSSAIERDQLQKIYSWGNSQRVYAYRDHWIVKEPVRFPLEEEIKVAIFLHAIGHQQFFGEIQIVSDGYVPRPAYLVRKVAGMSVQDPLNFYREEESVRLRGWDFEPETFEPYLCLLYELHRFVKAVERISPLRDLHPENVFINRKGDFIIVDARLAAEVSAVEELRAELERARERGDWKRVLIPAALIRPEYISF